MTHLSSDQFSESLLGHPEPGVTRHLDACAACRSELANLRGALGEFRGAVRGWSECQAAEYQANIALANSPLPPARPSWIAAHPLAMTLMLAVACVLASWVLSRAEKTPGGDAALLNQVDAQVSRQVPASMEPLMKLVVQE